MRSLVVALICIMLFIGASFAGKSFFGMQNHLSMDCMNRCINMASPFSAIPSIPIVGVIIFFCALVVWSKERIDIFQTFKLAYFLKDRFRIQLLHYQLATVIIRD